MQNTVTRPDNMRGRYHNGNFDPSQGDGWPQVPEGELIVPRSWLFGTAPPPKNSVHLLEDACDMLTAEPWFADNVRLSKCV